MSSLRASGSEQTRKTYARHRVKREMFGVSYGELEKLRKKIKVDDSLAQQLWDTGNHDARVLATMVADPAQATVDSLAGWVRDVDHTLIASAISGLAAKSKSAREMFETWSALDNDHASAAGWNVFAHLAMNDDSMADSYFEKRLAAIERQIHSATNGTKYAMNGAVIAIGLRNAKLEKLALAAAARIGKVEVDHGDTACKTPDAVAYIKKAAARKKH